MKSTSSVVLLGSALLPHVLASPGVVQLDIHKNRAVERAQLRRRGTVTTGLYNDRSQGLYSVNVSLGTPFQDVTLQIDTGSSDVWVPAAEASLCQSSDGCPGGSFDYKASSSFVVEEPDGFNISYVDGTGSSGAYFEDTFKIGGTTLDNFEMGLGLDTTIPYGILGIGYDNAEANVFTGNGSVYPNLPDALTNQGKIATPAYSLWLNDLGSSQGSILFGGIDTKKYVGDLIAIDVYPSEDADGNAFYDSFRVALTSVVASSTSGKDQLTPADYAEPIILDSGTTLTLLPNNIVAAIYAELGAQTDQQLGAVVPCSLGENSGTLDFQFGGVNGPVIKVGMDELVMAIQTTDGSQATFNDGTPACRLGLEAAGENPILFGDTFLRSAYVVYDLYNALVALAPTDFNTSDSNVVAFASLGAAIPSASSVSLQTSVVATETGNPNTEVSTSTVASVPTYNPTAPLQAESGFQTNTGPAVTTTSGSAAPGSIKPFDMSSVYVLALVTAWMAIGGGIMLL